MNGKSWLPDPIGGLYASKEGLAVQHAFALCVFVYLLVMCVYVSV